MDAKKRKYEDSEMRIFFDLFYLKLHLARIRGVNFSLETNGEGC